ncbi:hypothetical protein CL633_04490 [bacterium]|nr:hypothetical protein [bacterium]
MIFSLNQLVSEMEFIDLLDSHDCHISPEDSCDCQTEINERDFDWPTPCDGEDAKKNYSSGSKTYGKEQKKCSEIL